MYSFSVGEKVAEGRMRVLLLIDCCKMSMAKWLGCSWAFSNRTQHAHIYSVSRSAIGAAVG
jgi:hypothetical protein